MVDPDGKGRAWAEVDLKALQRNVLFAKKIANSEGGLMAIVKADAYGHGLVSVAEMLEPHIRFFGVANVAEARQLESAALTSVEVRRKKTFILSPALPEERELIVARDFIPSISSVEEAQAYDREARLANKVIELHAVIDTGMGRMGFSEAGIVRDWELLTCMSNVKVVGVASHFPSADEDEAYTWDQQERFLKILNVLQNQGHDIPYVHIHNSAGMIAFPPETSMIVRPGLMLYGISPNPQHQHLLEPVMSLYTRVTLVREMPRGQGISYGRAFVTKRRTRVATLSIGYGDGYPRHLSGKDASVLIRGRRCPVLGRVTMDQIMVDVTGFQPRVKPGEAAVLMGKMENEEILATELAEKAGTIPWEIFTGITRRVRRVYV